MDLNRNREEARARLEEVTEAVASGNTDSITPVITATAIGFALLDVADAIREQTAAVLVLAEAADA